MKKEKMKNTLRKILNYKYTGYILALIILFLALTVRIEMIEPLIILFVIFASFQYGKNGAIFSTIFAVITLGVQDLYNLHIELGNYLIEVFTVIIAAFYIIASSNQLRNKNTALKERVKELRGLFKISKVIDDPDIRLNQTLEEIVNIIPPTWQYPEDTCARIKYKDREFKTDNFQKTKWSQRTNIEIKGEKVGELEVCYLNQHPEEYNNTPFLKEEFELLEDTSERVSNVINSVKQEEKIKENNKFLSITLNSIGDAVIVTDREGQVTKMNKIAEELTGWDFEEAEGKDIKKVFRIVNAKTNEKVKNPIEKVFEEGKIVGLANHTKLISKDGSEYQIADSAAPIRDEEDNIYGAVMVFRDFTEKYNLNQEIQRREHLFSEAVKVAPYPLMIHSESGEVKQLNEAWQAISGYTKDDIPHIEDWYREAYGNKRNHIRSYVEQLFDKNQKQHDGEFIIKTKDGQERTWDFSSAPLGKDQDGNRLILSMAVDITERKEMINQINKLNRLYTILSDVNQVIVRNDSYEELFSKTCNVITENGNYRSAWIGRINQKENKLNVIGSAGVHKKLIDNVIIDLNDYNSTKQIEETYDINADTLISYINSDSDKIGEELIFYNNNRSMAIFPLIAFNQMWGILSLCIDEVNYFDDKELELLHELSSDLSYAVESIENEKLRKESEIKLKKSEKKYRELFENAPVGIFKSNEKGELILANPELLDILGFNSLAQTREFYNDLSSVYVNKEKRKELFEKLKRENEVDNYIFRAQKGNGNKSWLKLEARVNKYDTEGNMEIDGFIEDITKKYKMEQELAKSEEKYRSLFENQHAVMLILDPDSGKIVDANPAAVNYYGYSYEDLTSKNIDEINQLSQDKIYNKMDNASDSNKNIFEFKHQLADGEIRDVEVYSGPIKIENNEYLFSIIHDITERKKAEEKIKYMTFHDKLTGLYNRAYLEEEMNRIDTERQLPITLIMGDLNNLKLVNDTYGHQKGDELLVEAAEIIENCCRQEDIIARWGGDEYVVLLPNTTLDMGEKVCNRIFEGTRDGDGELLVSISLGCASKTRSNQDIFKVLNKAENRMYKNKITNRKSARSNVLSAFLNTLREKSYETEEHASRMKELSMKLGNKVGLSSSDLDRLSLLTSLHDIGKITIPQEILNKPDKLTEDEWNKVKEHTEAGYRIVSTMDEFADISEYILYHHERWDGSGYPEGISGTEIPLLSRILAIVDAYDVMTSGRPYKEPISQAEALEEIKECAGSQFDPNLVKLFVEILNE